MAVTLEDLAAKIQAEGVTEEYTNGANQSGRKISSNAKAYTSLIGKYTTITSKLLQLVPETPRDTAPTFNEIMDALSDDARETISRGFNEKRTELHRDIGFRDYVMGACE